MEPAWQDEVAAIIADADIGPPTDRDGGCMECGHWTPWKHPEAHEHEDSCTAPEKYRARRNWRARLTALVEHHPR